MSTPEVADVDGEDFVPLIRMVAGSGTAGFKGEGEPAVSAQLNRPYGVAVDSAGTLYFSDHLNHRVRKVTTDGKISTIAGNGTAGSTGDGGPATAARLNTPYGMALDAEDNLYVAEYNGNRIRKITPDEKISTVAGKGTQGFSGDGGPAASAQLYNPIGVVVDSAGCLCISEHNTHRIRKVAPDGTISTLAGNGTAGSGGDDGPAASAQMKNPFGLAVDGVDPLYIADHHNHRIRKITSERMAGLPESGVVVSWANTRSRLRIGVHRESLKDGAAIHQALVSPRAHQKWRLIATGQADGVILYRIENVRSGKVLEAADVRQTAGAPIAQRDYEGVQAHHQHWRLAPMSAETDTSTVYEIANHHSGLLLHAATNAPAALIQQDADGDPRNRQWQLLPA